MHPSLPKQKTKSHAAIGVSLRLPSSSRCSQYRYRCRYHPQITSKTFAAQHGKYQPLSRLRPSSVGLSSSQLLGAVQGHSRRLFALSFLREDVLRSASVLLVCGHGRRARARRQLHALERKKIFWAAKKLLVQINGSFGREKVKRIWPAVDRWCPPSPVLGTVLGQTENDSRIKRLHYPIRL